MNLKRLVDMSYADHGEKLFLVVSYHGMFWNEELIRLKREAELKIEFNFRNKRKLRTLIDLLRGDIGHGPLYKRLGKALRYYLKYREKSESG